MDNTKLYARSLMEMDLKEPHKIAGDLALVEKTFDFKLLGLLDNPLLTNEKKVEILSKIFKEQIAEESLKFIQFLAKEGQLKNLAKIRRSYERLLARQEAMSKVEIITASPLSEAKMAEIQESLQKKVGKTLSFEQKIEPNKLGGILIRVGDETYDNTLRRRIDELCQQII